MAPKDARISLASGCIAGAIEASATWPMEYVKTQLQTMPKPAPGAPPPPFTGIVSGLRYTIGTTGFFSLYTGLTPVLIFSVPKAGIRFGGNQFFRNQLKDAQGNVSLGSAFLAGLLAGITEGILVVTPQETIKTKLMNLNQSRGEPVSPMAGIRHIVATEAQHSIA